MLDSVLSPNQSAPNQVLGISSPNGESFQKHQLSNQSPTVDLDNSFDDVEDKENTQKMSDTPVASPLEVNTTGKPQSFLEDDVDEEEEPATTSPKRAAEELQEEGSPESQTKKARTNEDAQEEQHKESPPKTSKSSKSVDDLLADLAKAKSALQQSKSTLTLLKEHQEKLAENGAGMGARVEAFDKELTKLKETHAENGKELEKVLSLRDSAKQSFEAAAETLRKITEKKSKDEASVVNKQGTVTVKPVEDDSVAVVEKAEEEVVNEATDSENEMEKAEESTEQEMEKAEDSSDDVEGIAVEEEIEEAVEAKDSPEKKVNNEDDASGSDSPDRITNAEREAGSEDMPSPASTVEQDEEISEAEDVEASDTDIPSDEEDEMAEAKETLDFLGSDEKSTADSTLVLQMGNEIEESICNDDSILVKQSASTAATIDSSLALELQDGESDSDDDLLMM